MGKASYIGVSSKARKVKKGYIGVGGKAHKIKKAYIGVNGKARLWWSGGALRIMYESVEPLPYRTSEDDFISATAPSVTHPSSYSGVYSNPSHSAIGNGKLILMSRGSYSNYSIYSVLISISSDNGSSYTQYWANGITSSSEVDAFYIEGLCYHNGYFYSLIAIRQGDVGSSYERYLYKSTDGITWGDRIKFSSLSSSARNTDARIIACKNYILLVVGGNIYYLPYDGTTLTKLNTVGSYRYTTYYDENVVITHITSGYTYSITDISGSTPVLNSVSGSSSTKNLGLLGQYGSKGDYDETNGYFVIQNSSTYSDNHAYYIPFESLKSQLSSAPIFTATEYINMRNGGCRVFSHNGKAYIFHDNPLYRSVADNWSGEFTTRSGANYGGGSYSTIIIRMED